MIKALCTRRTCLLLISRQLPRQDRIRLELEKTYDRIHALTDAIEMVCCLNPDCQKPHNPEGTTFCSSCGTKLVLLRGHYRIIELLSDEGGFGRTYLAEDLDKLNERCVVKQLAPKVQGTWAIQKSVQLFEQEAWRLQEMGHHPQIPTLYAYFEQDKYLYLVQQWIEGQNLDNLLQQQGAWSESEIRDFLVDILPVLEFIHSRSVIHRDIKPANIIRRRSDRLCVLIDFGASKQLVATVVATGTTIGTYGYTPMEQMMGGEAHPASDLYSLGATCFHLLTKVDPRSLFVNHRYDWVQNWRQHLKHPLAQQLDRVLGKLLQKDQRQRYQSAAEVLKDLNQKPPLTPTLLPRNLTRRKVVKVIGFGGVGLLAPALIYQVIRNRPLIVSKLGRGDYKTIAEAIANAQSGTRIQVQPGRYQESLVIDKPLEIIGDGPVADIIIESTDSSCILMQTDYAVVRGITLRGQAGLKGNKYFAVDIPQGQLVLEDCDISCDSLSCVAIHGSTANPVTRRCKIHSGKEVGILVYENAQGTVEDCDIFGNTYAGVEIKQGSNPVIRQCQIHDGKGGGIFVYENGQGTVEDCDIFGNAYAGVEIKQGSSPVIRRCKIHSGKTSGIFVHENSQGMVEDCDIFGNALAGVAISAGGNPVIRQCKIHDGKEGGLRVSENGQGTVENCEIFGNGLSGVIILQRGNPVIRQCQIRDGKQNGVFVNENGQGKVEDCNIFGNAYSGVEITQGGNPIIRQCQINQNGYEAVRVHDKGAGTVENCDLTGNARGAFDIDASSQVRKSGNKE